MLIFGGYFHVLKTKYIVEINVIHIHHDNKHDFFCLAGSLFHVIELRTLKLI